MTGKAINGNKSARHVETAWLTGADAIAAVIGMNRNDIPNLVKTEGFPAFKWRGRWRALPEDISKWSRSMAKKYRRSRWPSERR